MKNIKVGDVVHVRAKVTKEPIGVGGLRIRIVGDNSELFISQGCIVHVEPRPLKIGDRVRHKPSNLAGVIKAICDDLAWLEIYSAIKDFRTIYMRDLELIND